MARYVFTSHDGFGLGHVRRNVSLAEAVLRRDPDASVTVVTGVEADVAWLRRADMRVVRVPSLVKDHTGRYRNARLGRAQAAARRSDAFRRVIDEVRPDVVVVDRHPFGTLGELREGLDRCTRMGTATVLGLRDVIDEADSVHAELASARWDGAASVFDHVLVYGARHVCDHETEYGLPIRPEYVGWVMSRPMRPRRQADIDPRRLVIAAGGGADGQQVRAVGLDLLRGNDEWHGLMVVGPLGRSTVRPDEGVHDRLEIVGAVDDCLELLSRSGASVQMAGYNTTVEALAAGIRPLLVPRRTPRREQLIRASRFAALGLADVVDDGADRAELSWLLRRPRRLAPTALASAGVDLDGAERTAVRLTALAGVTRHRALVAR